MFIRFSIDLHRLDRLESNFQKLHDANLQFLKSFPIYCFHNFLMIFNKKRNIQVPVNKLPTIQIDKREKIRRSKISLLMHHLFLSGEFRRNLTCTCTQIQNRKCLHLFSFQKYLDQFLTLLSGVRSGLLRSKIREDFLNFELCY